MLFNINWWETVDNQSRVSVDIGVKATKGMQHFLEPLKFILTIKWSLLSYLLGYVVDTVKCVFRVCSQCIVSLNDQTESEKKVELNNSQPQVASYTETVVWHWLEIHLGEGRGKLEDYILNGYWRRYVKRWLLQGLDGPESSALVKRCRRPGLLIG